ncbi:MAG TPA: hypothetical protein VJL27_00405 [Patescibacteria group bacterium]|nr:hypothetical protein [Patescibacteria group bacterium]
MPLDFTKLTQISYLTEQPPASVAYFWPIVIILAAALAVSLICWRLARRQPSKDVPQYYILINLTRWLSIPSLLGLILLFFRNQGIVYLSWRLWFVMLALVWLGAMVWLAGYAIFKYPKEIRTHNLRELKNKYIPQPKKSGG